ncbi:lipid III flippase WzxE [Dickeya dianthicola]|uniref:lipid III flippase WzxE n=1 Tax=Dickeya dianthicola TaxID=204039 RepID=UPI001F617993|nr:lipid III flippase WzxE [Dickeya dianthicola]MCI4203873.1 lipid III flippase WzxE [Dickeya dianthicola]MCI4210627.1 lipid III flippase WzxE [Dickeya dianthicola]MCI4224382.1 lipid III flippase WzxE [Dickeya dianthicola]
MSLARASLWTAASTLVKIGVGLVIIKLLAVTFGPEGVGLAGNYRQLITVLGVMAGAGIANGVTRAVAAAPPDANRPGPLLGTAVSLSMGCSLLLTLALWLLAAPLSRLLFGDDAYQPAIRALAWLQLGIAGASLLLAILKGYQDARGNALAVMAGSLLGAVAYGVSVWLGAYTGALVGLALMPALVCVPALALLFRRTPLGLRALTPDWSWPLAGQLTCFSLMTLITAVTLPVGYVMMRNQLAAHYTWQEVGLWQGVTTISDAWLQFITASFPVYLLPALARLQDKRAARHEILSALRFVLPAAAAVGVAIWLLRDVAIRLLFSSAFSAMRDLFAWQLAGDVLKVGAYVFGYLVVARASLRFYLLAELGQFLLLTGFARWLIPLHGALGAPQAYLATYAVYFLLCCGVFILYCRRA